MFKGLVFSLLFISHSLVAALIYDSNYQKDINIVESFDIDSTFLNDSVLNEILQKNISRARNRHFFNSMMDAYLFIPTIKNILTDSNVPSEFLYLAMAESNFYLKAESHKRAAGLWQFMPKTGKLLGLNIDDYVDERLDLIKSTKAAAKYLTYLHKRFGKWYLAALAYNCGEGRVSAAIKKAGTDDLKTLLDPEKKYLPLESRIYIRKIVAFSMMASNELFLLKSEYRYLLNRASAYSLSVVSVPKGERISRVAKLIDMPVHELKALNSHLKYDFIPPYEAHYDLYIPYIKLADFNQKYTPADLRQIYKVHTVVPGDNLSKIGKKYGVRYGIIKDFNNLRSNKLSLKQKLIIPIDAKKRMVRKRSENTTYTVKNGDTLISIARVHNLSVKTLKRVNNKTGSLVRIGEKLRIK